jgi:hypothetical protein
MEAVGARIGNERRMTQAHKDAKTVAATPVPDWLPRKSRPHAPMPLLAMLDG